MSALLEYEVTSGRVSQSLNPVRITTHAKQRAKERFNGDENWLRNKALTAKYVGITLDHKGRTARYFVNNGVGIIAALQADVIISVIEPYVKGGVRRKFAQMAQKEIAKSTAIERQAIRKLERLQAEIEQEIGHWRMKLANARSLPKKLAYQGRIKALKMRLDEFPDEVFVIKRKAAKVNEGLSQYM